MEIEDKISKLERVRIEFKKACAESLFDIDNEIEKIKNELARQKSDKYTLKLSVDNDNSLKACVNDIPILRINREGRMSALHGEVRRYIYKQWVDNGMLVCSKSVKWRGKEYYINRVFQLCLIGDNEIFDFEYASVESPCNDDNIVRYEHSKTPILF